MGAVLTNDAVEGNLATVNHSPDSILSVQLHAALNIRGPARAEYTGYSVLTEHGHTVVHAGYSAGRNHAGECHVGFFFDEVTGCNVHGVVHVTACGRHAYYSRRRNFQLVTLSTGTSCADCTFQSGIGNGNNLARATVLLKGIGYDAQPGFILGVRLFPCFKSINKTFSVNSSPLALIRKVRSKSTNVGLRFKLSAEIFQSLREIPDSRKARRRNSHAPRTSLSTLAGT